MKKTILLSILMAGVSFAGFEKWTNKDGKAADLELVKVTETAGVKTGEFKMRNGKTISLKATDLSEADAKRLDEWKPAATAEATPAAAPSVFDKLLEGDLIKVDGKKVSRAKDVAKPEKYYVFYYSASWCQPCQKFTPSLVEFYNKSKNASFEVYFISSDTVEADMEGYMKEKSMPWPALKLGKVEKFKKEINHGVDGIPFIAIVKPDGTVVDKGNAYPMLPKLQALVAK
jgi:nucleoredoxin